MGTRSRGQMSFVADRTILRVDGADARQRTASSSSDGYAGGSTVVSLIDPSYDRITTDNACVLLIDHQIGTLWELEFAKQRRSVVELAADARRLRLTTIITAIGIESLGPIIPKLK